MIRRLSLKQTDPSICNIVRIPCVPPELVQLPVPHIKSHHSDQETEPSLAHLRQSTIVGPQCKWKPKGNAYWWLTNPGTGESIPADML